MKIIKKYLLVVEGQVTEPSILKTIFTKYGFSVHHAPKIHLTGFNIEDYTFGDKYDIIIAQGPRNRIGELVKKYKSDETDLKRIFKLCNENFAGIFLIYDVDHTSNNDLEEMFRYFNDESEGLLLVSSPCIEVISDFGRTEELKCKHLKEYKSQLNTKLNKEGKESAKKYTLDNFEDLIINFLDKNTQESNNTNIMEHPQFVIEKINSLNIRKNTLEGQEVIYRYFTTVIYVCIAYVLGLTKEIENYDIVRQFFINQK